MNSNEVRQPTVSDLSFQTSLAFQSDMSFGCSDETKEEIIDIGFRVSSI